MFYLYIIKLAYNLRSASDKRFSLNGVGQQDK